jgi:hypothetical protein
MAQVAKFGAMFAPAAWTGENFDYALGQPGVCMTIVVVLLLGCVGVFIIVHNVPIRPTKEDREYAEKILCSAGITVLRKASDCKCVEEELRLLQIVQGAVLSASPRSVGIPKGHSREPRDLYELRQGLCYDRSRVIEKILTIMGFKNRHAALFSIENLNQRRLLLDQGLPSHHVTEVMTRAGWTVLDSNSSWIGLDERQPCISLSKLKRTLPSERRVSDADPILATNFIFVYGLYARHGHFYWPYDHVPDINVIQFLRGLPILLIQLWSFWKPKKYDMSGTVDSLNRAGKQQGINCRRP